jgi:hypothetical protein
MDQMDDTGNHRLFDEGEGFGVDGVTALDIFRQYALSMQTTFNNPRLERYLNTSR